MKTIAQLLLAVVPIGVVATLIFDAWGALAMRLFGMPAPNWALVGRWIGHFRHGIFRHDRIADARSVRREALVGWTAHYAVGILFAGLLLLLAGMDWLRDPSLLPALGVGLLTVAAPFFLMQPSMGMGVAASRAPNPTSARLRSILAHSVFGVGLYAGGLLLSMAGNYG